MVLYQFSWFGFKVSILGISVGITVIFIYGVLHCISKKHTDIIQTNKIADLIISVGVFTLLISRAVYIVFNWNYYTVESSISNEIFKIWHGGFSLSGAIIGFLISYWVITYILDIKSTSLIDLLSPILVFSFFIIGLGNYFNQKIQEDATNFFIENGQIEIMDIISDHSILENKELLYESCIYILAGLILLRLLNRGFPRGFIFNCLIMLVSTIRFVFSNISSSVHSWEYYATHLITIASFSISLALIIGLKLFLRTEDELKDNIAEKQRNLFDDH